MLSGLSMAGLIIIYGPMKYRRVIVNDFGIDDWKLPVVWVFMIRFVKCHNNPVIKHLIISKSLCN